MMIISPSLLAADHANLKEAAKAMKASGADWLHVDCFDGHFVPTLAFSADTVKALRAHTDMPLDVHYMAETPHQYIDATAAAGATHMTIHVEAYDHAEGVKKCLDHIKASGMKTGLALHANSEVNQLFPFVEEVDLFLIMAVRGGFGGDPFQPQAIQKVHDLKQYLIQQNLQTLPLISVDGGVSLENAPALIDAGADVLCAGSSIFKAPDPAQAIAAFKHS